jgi:hypothetical protein
LLLLLMLLLLLLRVCEILLLLCRQRQISVGNKRCSLLSRPNAAMLLLLWIASCWHTALLLLGGEEGMLLCLWVGCCSPCHHSDGSAQVHPSSQHLK